MPPSWSRSQTRADRAAPSAGRGVVLVEAVQDVAAVGLGIGQVHLRLVKHEVGVHSRLHKMRSSECELHDDALRGLLAPALAEQEVAVAADREMDGSTGV